MISEARKTFFDVVWVASLIGFVLLTAVGVFLAIRSRCHPAI